MDKILAHDAVAAAIVTTLGTIVLAIVGKMFGFWTWIAAEASKWLEHRRKVGMTVRPIPKRTMHIVVDNTVTPPLWSKHDSGNGRSATDCRTPLLITNLQMTSAVKPRNPVVRIRGLNRFRRKAYDIRLTGPAGHVDETILPQSTRSWWIFFMVLPEMEPKKTLKVDIVIHDEFDNPHVVKNVRFTSGFPDALPT